MAFSVLNMFTTFWILFSNHLVLSAEEPFCRSSFFALHKNRYLPNHVIHTTTVTSHLECSMECLALDDCQSWNMEKTSSGNTCELNNVTMETAAQNDTHLMIKVGAQFGQRVFIAPPKLKLTSYLFTSLGAKGKNGPSDVTRYTGTSLESQVTLDNGIQQWTVPHAGTYRIVARGASGANGTCVKPNHTESWNLGGLGARIKGKFRLQKGTILKVLVGQLGITNTDFGDRAGGGGGGSFVTFANSTPLVIAGGGGGGGACLVVQGLADGDSGQMGELGSQCNSITKQGGLLCSSDDQSPSNLLAGAGAGLLGDGKGAMASTPGSHAFVNGGLGGSVQINSFGGFGGGGYGWLYGGGGGGYSGGGVCGSSTSGVAGGGGSVNNGLEAVVEICESREDGLVKINFVDE